MTSVTESSHSPYSSYSLSLKVGMRVSTSQGYHKGLLKFDTAKYSARLKVNVQNLFSFLPSSLSLPPFYFPIFCFQDTRIHHVYIVGHAIPMAPKATLTNRAFLTPTEISSVCFLPSPKLHHWQSQRVGPLNQERVWASGTIQGQERDLSSLWPYGDLTVSGMMVRCHNDGKT